LISYYIRNNIIEDEGAISIMKGVEQNERIKSLRFRNVKITDNILEPLSNILKNNENLTVLDLSQNLLTVEGGIQISKILRENKKIHTFYMAGNKIGEYGGKYIGKLIQKNETLTFIDIASNNVSDVGAEVNN
jgi:Ran GTPase-activating protein (RanGAP) involved in mRNA processing and transport